MTAPDPRLGEIEARLSAHYECIAYADDIPEGQEWEVPEDYERHYCNEDGKDWPCPDVTDYAQEDIHYLLAELRTAREALARVEALHKPVKIYDECDCPDGTHPDEYDYIDCEDYVGCENSLSGVGCQECCVDSWDSLTQDCGENHSHSKDDPAFRCDTIKTLRAAVAARKAQDNDRS